MGYSLRCPLCRGKFPWNPDDGFPDQCKVCKEYIGTGGKDEVVLPFISTAKGRGSADKVYREIEKASENRQEMAAEMLGVSKSEVSDIKITNMNDRQRTGDIAAVSTLTPQQRQMADAASNASRIGIQASQFVRQGPLPGAGTSFIQNTLKPSHSSSWGAPTSDNPSLGVRTQR